MNAAKSGTILQTELHKERKKHGSCFQPTDVGKAETKAQRAILYKADVASDTNT